MNIINRKQIYTALLLLPYFFAVTGMLVLDSGDKKLIPLFLISIIVSILTFKKETIINNLRSPFVLLVLVSCFYTVFSYYYHGSSSRELRALIGTTIFLLIFPHRLLTKKTMLWIILLSAMTLCMNSLYYNIYIGVTRTAGYINPIPYATACALISIVAFSLLINTSNIKEKTIPLLAFLLSLPPIILSEARGVWLAFTISLVILVILKYIESPPTKRTLVLTIISSIILLYSGAYLFKDKITERYNVTVHEINKINNNDYRSSIGLRLQMWELTPELMKNKPLLGYGNSHVGFLKKKLNEKSILSSVFYFASNHYHNQFLDRVVKSGIIGLFLLIGILTYPLMKVKNLQGYKKNIVIGATSLFFTSGLTDVPFNHPQPLILYLLFLVPICSRGKRVTND